MLIRSAQRTGAAAGHMLSLPNTLKVTANLPLLVRKALDRLCDHWTHVHGKPTGWSPSAQSAVSLNFKGTGAETPLQLGMDEAFAIDIGADQIDIEAETLWGYLRALETLATQASLSKGKLALPLGKVTHTPAYAWRGLMLDVARRFQPLEALKRQIDGMSLVHLNTLHLHLCDNEAFRVECRQYPKLHEIGANGRYYTQNALRDLVAYAAERGIRIVPEIDVPGHTLSWMVAYPELGTLPDGTYDFSDPNRDGYAEALDPSNEKVFDVVRAVFEEVAEIFPDKCFHIGGDEVWATSWSQPHIDDLRERKNLAAGNHSVQSYFNGRIFPELARLGKRPMGWEEVLECSDPESTIAQVWMTGLATRPNVRNRDIVVSQGYYIDHMRSASYYYETDPSALIAKQTNDRQKDNINVLGGEAAMWTPLTGPENIDLHIWPNLVAVAQRFWSEGVLSTEALYGGLDAIMPHLCARGIRPSQQSRTLIARNISADLAEEATSLAQWLSPVVFFHFIAGTWSRPQDGLSRYADALAPDSAAVRQFEADIAAFIEGTDHAALPATLLRIISELTPLTSRAAIGGDDTAAILLAGRVCELAKLAQQAATTLETKDEAGAEELKRAGALLDATKPIDTLGELGGLIMMQMAGDTELDLSAALDGVRAKVADRPLPLQQINIAIQPAIEQLVRVAIHKGQAS